MSQVRATIETDCTTRSTTLRGRLLRRLGDASLGFPDGKPYWFLHLREPNEYGEYDIDEFDTCQAAVDALNTKARPELYVVSGPLVSTEEEFLFLRATSARQSFRAAVPSLITIDTPLKSVVLHFDDTTQTPVELDAKKFDALFWGRSSVHKFVVPYYVAAEGLKYGVMVNDRFRGKKLCDGTPTAEPPAYALVHEPDTEYALQLYPGGGGTPTELPPV
jgi:hypothetical protein